MFWSAAMISTIAAILASSLPWKQSLDETRVVTSYLMFFAVTNLIRDKRQIKLLIRGIIFLGLIVAMITIAQHFFAQSHVLTVGRIEDATVEGTERISDVARIVPPGLPMMMVGLAALFAAFVFEKGGTLRFFQLGSLAMGLIVTFYRSSWAATGLTVLITGLMAKRDERKRLVVFCLVTGLLAVVVIMASMSRPESHGAKLLEVAYKRLITLFNSRTYEDPNSSLRWRDFEYKYALPHIISNPLIGIGLGAYYRPFTLGKDWGSEEMSDTDEEEPPDLRSWVHNGHVNILLKTGIFGYAGLMWFMINILARGFRYWRHMTDPYIRGVVLAITLTSQAILIICIVEPYFVEIAWTSVVGITAGINEVAFRLFLPESPIVNGEKPNA
jgi:hypothetical protein